MGKHALPATPITASEVVHTRRQLRERDRRAVASQRPVPVERPRFNPRRAAVSTSTFALTGLLVLGIGLPSYADTASAEIATQTVSQNLSVAEVQQLREDSALLTAAAAAPGSAQVVTVGSSTGAVGSPLPNAPASSGYGMRFHPVLHTLRFHYGTDFPARIGTPILAIADGVIVGAGSESGMGNHIDVRSTVDGQVIVSRYFHLSSIGVSVGQQVVKGQVIGATGNTGTSTGPHLHFEIHLGTIDYGTTFGQSPGDTVDPRTWLSTH